MTQRLAATAILDAALMLAAVLKLCPVALALLGHALICAAALAIWLAGRRTLGTAATVAAMLGPWALMLASWLRPRRTPSEPAPVDRETPEPHRPGLSVAFRMLDGRVHHASPRALGSMVTIMRHGSVHDRRRALESVVRSFRPTLSPLLAIALNDRDQTIRALAAAAVARVGQNLATARAASNRTDARCQNGDHDLAALLVDHARGNVLLSDSQRDHLRDDALALLGTEGCEHEGLKRQTLIEARWAAGDYAAVDALVAELAPSDAIGAGAAIDWWRRAAS